MRCVGRKSIGQATTKRPDERLTLEFYGVSLEAKNDFDGGGSPMPWQSWTELMVGRMKIVRSGRASYARLAPYYWIYIKAVEIGGWSEIAQEKCFFVENVNRLCLRVVDIKAATAPLVDTRTIGKALIFTGEHKD